MEVVEIVNWRGAEEGDDIRIMQVLKELDRPILYSLSPGTSVTPSMAKDVNGLVNMYRITGDDWDSWGDVSAHFDISRCSMFFSYSLKCLSSYLLHPYYVLCS